MAAKRKSPSSDMVLIDGAYAAFVEVLRISALEDSREALLRVLLRRTATHRSGQTPSYDQLCGDSHSNLERLLLVLIDAVTPPLRGRRTRRMNLIHHLIWCAPNFIFLVELAHEALICEPPLREAREALLREHGRLVACMAVTG